MKKTKIAFDLDGVLIDKPPFISKKLLERLFRGKNKDVLQYRFPHSKIEQLIRKLSHYYLFRPPLTQNIQVVRRLAKDSKFELYVISARYSFLRSETENWLEKREIKSLFKEIFINLSDDQPHLFKEKKLKEIKADIFVDDDGRLSDYLAEKLKIKIFCFGKDRRCQKAKNIDTLKKLTE